MNLTLSWDLFIIVFFALVVTYSFIIGKKESVKVIVASYMAVVAVQGLSNLLERLLGSNSAASLNLLGFSLGTSSLSIVRTVLFITIVVFLAVRSGVEIQYLKEGSWIINALVTALFGFASAGLLLSIVVTYISGADLLDVKLTTAASLSPIIQQSQLMQVMILNQDLWFAFPAILLIAVGFL